MFRPGHKVSLQTRTSSEMPTQSVPPPEGTGSLHDLVLTCDPFPQLLLHEEYELHSPH